MASTYGHVFSSSSPSEATDRFIPGSDDNKVTSRKENGTRTQKISELTPMEREQLLLEINSILGSLSDKALEDLLTFLKDIVGPQSE